VVKTAGFHPFSGQIAPERDTDDGRDETRDGREKRPGQERDDDGDGESREDRAPVEWGNGAAFDVMRVRSVKEESGLRKKKPIREAYADRWVRERCRTRSERDAIASQGHLLLLGLLSSLLLLRRHWRSPPSGHALFDI
jgi:hypothetical protein